MRGLDIIVGAVAAMTVAGSLVHRAGCTRIGLRCRAQRHLSRDDERRVRPSQRRLQGRADDRRDVDLVLELRQPDRMRRHGDELRGLDRSDVARLPEHLLGCRPRHPQLAAVPGRDDRPRRAEVPVLGDRSRVQQAKLDDQEPSGRPQRTNSPSGSCGRNQPLVIETPLKFEQLSYAAAVRSAAGPSTTSAHDRRRHSSAVAPVRRVSRTARCAGHRARRQRTVRQIRCR